jgi:hypothetical protein
VTLVVDRAMSAVPKSRPPAASPTPSASADAVRGILAQYDEPLVRQVAQQLVKPRSHWPLDELIERCLATLDNAPVVDRRLQALDPAARQLLILVGQSRQPGWRLGNLLEMLVALGHPVGVQPVLQLLESGLAYPQLPRGIGKLKSFDHWLGLAFNQQLAIHTPTQVTSRALQLERLLSDALVPAAASPPHVLESDGLDWILRLAVVFQQVAAQPLRRTQNGDFFKRDLERLKNDPLLAAPVTEAPLQPPDPGLLAVEWALRLGVLVEERGELRAAHPPFEWNGGLDETIAVLFAALLTLDSWDARHGWRGRQTQGNPSPSAYLLALALLASLPNDAWADPNDIDAWLTEHHPYWSGTPMPGNQDDEENKSGPRRHGGTAIDAFLFGVAFPLKLVQIGKDLTGTWLVRMSSLGRHVFGVGPAPEPAPTFPKTLMVQPNLEIIAFRQGLTPTLIARLGRAATWKTIGAACTLLLEPDQVYRGLESGMTFESILRMLEQHGMRPTPPAVVDALRTWSNKRERISVYPAATLLEFSSRDELEEAISRGLAGVRLSDRLALVVNERDIDFRQYRLTGTRDYGLAPEACVAVADDGVTLEVDVTRSDLMLETELSRFAEPAPTSGTETRRRYRLTPTSLATGLRQGITPAHLDEWFRQRTSGPPSPACRLLLAPALAGPVQAQPLLVLRVASPDIADGLWQWPETRTLLVDRLGPTALVIADGQAPELLRRLKALGVSVHESF